ncbi:hypothetical protein B0H10DRAFT_2142243 [Mycena sp. CBHHK59/15]|nr:hypothetical protein B0H10DRAFT_2142243 [Mycena sp. CBHHK59/15]
MPRVAQNQSHQHRGAGGMFTAPPLSLPDTQFESDGDSDIMWESDTESEKDTDYFEAWERLPVPWEAKAKEMAQWGRRTKEAKAKRMANGKKAAK